MEALGRNIIEVFEDFASQEGLEIFTSSFTLVKLDREEILLRGGKFSWSCSRSYHVYDDDHSKASF